MKPKNYPVCDDITEVRQIKPHDPDPRHWPPYDEWHREKKREPGVYRFWNSRYSVTTRPETKQSLVNCECWRMLIMRADQSAHHDYRDYMRIKDDIFGEEYEAIELYPARSRETDPSNAFVLFVFERRLRIGETQRLVCLPDESQAPQRHFYETPIESP